MSEQRKATIEDFIKVTRPESTDPEYLAWKKAKIEAAIKHADEHPDDYLTMGEVWKRLGLEY